MSGLYPLNDKQSSVAGSYYFRQYELKRIYKKNFYNGMFLAIGVHAVVFLLLILYAPVLTKPPAVRIVLLPPVNVDYKVMDMRIVGHLSSGMDVSGSGGGNGTIPKNADAAFANATAARSASSKSTINPKASIVPRSLQGPGMNDIVGVARQPVYFDTVSGYSGNSRNGEGSGGGVGSTIGDTIGTGSGLTGKPGFGGGFGNKFVPGNPGNNSAAGTPYAISWNGVARALVSGNRPQFPPGVQNGGVVKIRIVVDPAGNVVSMIPLQKSGSRLEEASMAAIRTWEFSRLSRNYPQVNQSAVATFVFKAE
ncbi:MAG: energy transducer TonB [Bacteroidetes bacterium]|nr:energy transducer TonB [Bacteroidota bacterium]